MKHLLLAFGILMLFNAEGQFQLNGVATNLGGDTYQLTPAANSQYGAIWYKLRHNLDQPLNIEGRFNFGGDPAGADGITFVMQNGCLATGGSGGGIGYSNMPGQSIGIEFDTYQNIAGTGAEINNDPAYDHITVEKSGDVVHDASANDITTPVQMDAALSNVKTGNWYDFRVAYDPATQNLRVFFNGSLRVNITYDIKNNIFGGANWVYWGFTSSTGGHNNIQQVFIDRSLTTHPLGDTTICPGASVPITLDPLTSLRGTNIAVSNPATASTNNGSAFASFDGNMGTRWESAFSDPQWIMIDLQSPTDLDSVILYWEVAYGSGYEIQTSTDGSSWTTAFSTTTGDGGKDKIVLASTNVRYVRMYGTARGTPWGFSLWEFQVYGQPKYLWSPNNGTVSDIYASTVTITPTGTTTYSVMIPDACLGFTSVSFTITVYCPVLPVTFSDFTVIPDNGTTQLYWTTSQELQTSYFQIVKSLDGIHFYPIKIIPAIGNTNASSNYTFTEEGLVSETAYYQIIAVDLDGTQTASAVKSVSYHNQQAYLASPVFEGETSLIIPAGVSEAEYCITDINGRIISCNKHITSFSEISIGKDLAPANYFITVTTDRYSITLKACKVN